MYRFYLFIQLLLLFSCSPKKNELYVFEPESKGNNNFTLGMIADDIYYIPLEDTIKLRQILDIKLSDKSLFVSTSEGLFMFDHLGKFIRSIGKKGAGPGEYLFCNNIAVDEHNDIIYIKDRNNVIKVYSTSGAYIRDIKIKNLESGIDIIDIIGSKLFVSHFLQFGSSKYNWVIIDSSGTILQNKERTVPFFSSNWLEGSITYNYNNSLYYWNPYNDTVYSISSNLENIPAFLFGQGDYRLPESSFSPDQEITSFMLVRTLFETKKYLVLRYSLHGNGFITLIVKHDGDSFTINVEDFENGGILNNIDGGVDFQPISCFFQNDQEFLVGLISPWVLKKHVNSTGFIKSSPIFIEKKQNLEIITKNLSDTDNPVLMLVKLKDGRF